VVQVRSHKNQPQHTQEDLLNSWLSLTSGSETGNNPVRLPVLSGSMLPDIPPGSTLVIAPCTALNVQRGDVVVFLDGERLVAHRLLLHFNIGPLQVLFQKGDNNTRGGWLSPAQIKGLVLEVQRKHDIIPVSSNRAASESLLHLFRCFARNLIFRRREP